MIVLTIFLLALAKATFFSNFGFGLVDEGQSLHTALKILNGGLPYRDFFAVFPPLHYYIYALPALILEPSVLAPRLFTSLIFSATPPLVYMLCRQFSSRKIALIPALLLIIINPNVDRLYFLTFIFAAIYLAQIRKHCVLAGLFFGLSGWFRLDITLAIFGSYCLFSLSKLPQLLLGFSLPVLLLVGWLGSHGLVSAFIHNAILEPIAITNKHDLPFPLPTNLQSAYLTYVFYLILAVYVVSLIFLVKMPNFRQTLGFWVVSGLLMLPYMLGRTDMGHLTKGSLPFFILGPFLVQRLQFKLLVWILIIGLFSGGLVESVAWLRLHNQTAVIGQDHLRLPATYLPGTTYPSATTLTATTEFLATSPSGRIATMPYMAGLYYLAGRVSPTRYDNVLYGYLPTPEAQQAFIAQLAPVDRVVYDPIGGPKTQIISMAIYNPLIHSYLMTNYTIITTTPEGWQFLVKHD